MEVVKDKLSMNQIETDLDTMRRNNREEIEGLSQ